jgi:hypothetical protein
MNRKPSKSSQSWAKGETVTPMGRKDPWNPYLVQNRPLTVEEVRGLL